MNHKKDSKDIGKNRTIRISDNEFAIIKKNYKKLKPRVSMSRWIINTLMIIK